MNFQREARSVNAMTVIRFFRSDRDKLVDKFPGLEEDRSSCSQGRVKVPTGGNPIFIGKPASAPPSQGGGQQIW
jgi:hypothetical protein